MSLHSCFELCLGWFGYHRLTPAGTTPSRLRVRELREIDLQLSGRNYSQGKINATAGGKQSLEPKMIAMLKNDYLESNYAWVCLPFFPPLSR